MNGSRHNCFLWKRKCTINLPHIIYAKIWCPQIWSIKPLLLQLLFNRFMKKLTLVFFWKMFQIHKHRNAFINVKCVGKLSKLWLQLKPKYWSKMCKSIFCPSLKLLNHVCPVTAELFCPHSIGPFTCAFQLNSAWIKCLTRIQILVQII